LTARFAIIFRLQNGNSAKCGRHGQASGDLRGFARFWGNAPYFPGNIRNSTKEGMKNRGLNLGCGGWFLGVVFGALDIL